MQSPVIYPWPLENSITEGLPVAGNVGAGIVPSHLFFGFEGAGSVAGLREQRPGELDERRGEL